MKINKTINLTRLIANIIILFFISTTYCKAVSISSKDITVKAKAAELIEPTTQTVLYAFNPTLRIPPASLTKIMTLFLTFEAIEEGSIHLNDMVWISKRAWKTGGSRMFVEVGTRVPLEILIKGIAVASGNDACVAVAEHIAGSVEAFVKLMNEKAQMLGLKNTHFVNPHGLDDPDQYSTVEDIARLASIYINRFPQALKYHSTVEFTYNGIKQFNRNKLLLRDSTIDGLKTGYVSRGGYHLVATANRNGMRLIAVVMGAKTPSLRLNETYKLLNFGFRNYTIINPPDFNKPIGSVNVWKSTVATVQLYPKSAKPIILKKDEAQHVLKKLELPEEIVAPIKKNTVIGYMKIYLNKKVIQTVPLIIKEDIQKAPWYLCVYQSIMRKINKGTSSILHRNKLNLSNFALIFIGLFFLFTLVFIIKTIKRRKKRKSLSRIRRF